MKLPVGYPVLLGTLAALIADQLRTTLVELPGDDRDALAVDLAETCRKTCGGLRIKSARAVLGIDLRYVDPTTYGRLYDAYDAQLARLAPGQPDAWRQQAAAVLLDLVRQTFGCTRMPKGRSMLVMRNSEMYDHFKGDYQQVAVEYGVGQERARQIISERLAEEREKRQPKLF